MAAQHMVNRLLDLPGQGIGKGTILFLYRCTARQVTFAPGGILVAGENSGEKQLLERQEAAP